MLGTLLTDEEGLLRACCGQFAEDIIHSSCFDAHHVHLPAFGLDELTDFGSDGFSVLGNHSATNLGRAITGLGGAVVFDVADTGDALELIEDHDTGWGDEGEGDGVVILALGHELGGSAVSYDAALGDKHYSRADGFDFFEDVGGENDSAAALGAFAVSLGVRLGHFFDQATDFVLLVGIEAIGGFIHDQDIGFVQDGLSQTDAAFETFGEGFDGLTQDALEVGSLNSATDGGFLGFAFEASDLSAEVQEGFGGHVGVGGGTFGEVADGGFDFEGVLGDICAAHYGGAGGWREEAGDHFHGGAFACAVGAEEAQDFAAFYFESDVVNGEDAAGGGTSEAFTELFEFDECGHILTFYKLVRRIIRTVPK